MLPISTGGTKCIPASARGAIRAAPTTWHRWLETCQRIEADEADPDAEDWAVFLAQYSQLRRLGVPFDPGFSAKVKALQDEIAAGMYSTFLEDADFSDDVGDSEEERGARRFPWPLPNYHPARGKYFDAAEHIWKALPKAARRKNHPATPLMLFVLRELSEKIGYGLMTCREAVAMVTNQ